MIVEIFAGILTGFLIAAFLSFVFGVVYEVTLLICKRKKLMKTQSSPTERAE